MSTAAQFAANRANAQKSTGPRSVEGKAVSRFNALTHGMDAASIVIPGEDPAVFEAISDDYHRQFDPQSALEQFHVDTLIRSDWQKRRLQRTEAKLYRALLAEGPTAEDLDVAVLRDSPTAKLRRIEREREEVGEDTTIVPPAYPMPQLVVSGTEANPSAEIPPELRL
jgi:hypothetical protein